MKDLKAFEALIDRWVTTQNFSGNDALRLNSEVRPNRPVRITV